MSPSRYLNLAGPDDPEFTGWDRDVIRALQVWEAGCCPGCGLPLSDTLKNSKLSPAEQARYTAGFRECGACEWLERSQHAQHTKDEAEQKQRGDDHFIPTRHRLWFVRPYREPGGDA